MNATELIRDYGYLAVIVGTFFEGELIMLAAGVAAAAGMMSLSGVFGAGMLGIFCSDTFCFLLGRFLGDRLARWFPKLHSRLGGVFRMIERHDEKLIVFFQFFPGLCTVTPVAFGMTKISVVRFMTLDLVGNTLWTVLFTLAGYVLGSAAEYFWGYWRWQIWLVVALLVMAGAVLFGRHASRSTRVAPPV